MVNFPPYDHSVSFMLVGHTNEQQILNTTIREAKKHNDGQCGVTLLPMPCQTTSHISCAFMPNEKEKERKHSAYLESLCNQECAAFAFTFQKCVCCNSCSHADRLCANERGHSSPWVSQALSSPNLIQGEEGNIYSGKDHSRFTKVVGRDKLIAWMRFARCNFQDTTNSLPRGIGVIARID
jgi:hypothetical protein